MVRALSRPRLSQTYGFRAFCQDKASAEILSVATPAEPRGEKKNFFFVRILGGEKLLKFVEKCQ